MRWLLGLLVACGLLALAYRHMQPPHADPDAATLAYERTTRQRAHRAGAPLPGISVPPGTLTTRLARDGFKLGQPIFIRVFKLSFELEVWIKRGDTFALFTTYPICTFSGQLGPKLRNLDRQAPEGVYQVTARQLNPNSRWHRSFNLGFPNAYDRTYGRTGSYLMVHGGCSSIGCYAITNQAADDLFTLAKSALASGQPSFQLQALPFRMTAEALARRASNPNAPFWTELKPIADAFETSRVPPDVMVCNGHYSLVRQGGAAGCKKI